TAGVNVLANDSSPGGRINPATVAIASGPGNGSVGVDPVTGVITYTPNPGFASTDTFGYTVQDDMGLTSNSGQVAVVVSGDGSPQFAAVDSTAIPPVNTAVVVNVWDNFNSEFDESMPHDLLPHTAGVLAPPGNGAVDADPDTGEVTYR